MGLWGFCPGGCGGFYFFPRLLCLRRGELVGGGGGVVFGRCEMGDVRYAAGWVEV